jgi:hypothetical protein
MTNVVKGKLTVKSVLRSLQFFGLFNLKSSRLKPLTGTSALVSCAEADCEADHDYMKITLVYDWLHTHTSLRLAVRYFFREIVGSTERFEH